MSDRTWPPGRMVRATLSPSGWLTSCGVRAAMKVFCEARPYAAGVGVGADDHGLCAAGAAVGDLAAATARVRRMVLTRASAADCAALGQHRTRQARGHRRGDRWRRRADRGSRPAQASLPLDAAIAWRESSVSGTPRAFQISTRRWRTGERTAAEGGGEDAAAARFAGPCRSARSAQRQVGPTADGVGSGQPPRSMAEAPLDLVRLVLQRRYHLAVVAARRAPARLVRVDHQHRPHRR